MLTKKSLRRRKIRYRVRKKIFGTENRPRLSVYRSNKEIYAQVIDDEKGLTLASFSSRKLKDDVAGKTKSEVSELVGKELGKLTKNAGITTIVFDRGGYLYHGRVKSLADGVRSEGIIF
jgi:large subunit ribosomal protein L18